MKTSWDLSILSLSLESVSSLNLSLGHFVACSSSANRAKLLESIIYES